MGKEMSDTRVYRVGTGIRDLCSLVESAAGVIKKLIYQYVGRMILTGVRVYRRIEGARTNHMGRSQHRHMKTWKQHLWLKRRCL